MKEKIIQHNTEVSIHELLEHYTNWLVKRSYTDTDPIYEESLAVDEYLKENLPANFLREYADWKIKECLPEKKSLIRNMLKEDEIYQIHGMDGVLCWNKCITKILSNKDKK